MRLAELADGTGNLRFQAALYLGVLILLLSKDLGGTLDEKWHDDIDGMKAFLFRPEVMAQVRSEWGQLEYVLLGYDEEYRERAPILCGWTQGYLDWCGSRSTTKLSPYDDSWKAGQHILQIPAHDGYILPTCLCLPRTEEEISEVILYVHDEGGGAQYGSIRRGGKCTSLQGFFGNRYPLQGIAYCSFSVRGTWSNYYYSAAEMVNLKGFEQYLPSNTVEDVASVIRYLKSEEEQLKNAKVTLMGWGEGSVLAPLVARRGDVPVDRLVLVSYWGKNLRDIIDWRYGGGAAYASWEQALGVDRKGYIEREDYRQEGPLEPWSFDQLDPSGTGKIDESTARALCEPRLRELLAGIERGEDVLWFREHFGFFATAPWFREHFALRPTDDVLMELDIPVLIFQAEWDDKTPWRNAQALRERARAQGKDNIRLRLYEKQDRFMGLFDETWEENAGLKDLLALDKSSMNRDRGLDQRKKREKTEAEKLKANRIKFPNKYGHRPLPKEQAVRDAQEQYGFSDALARFYLTQNGLQTDKLPRKRVAYDNDYPDLRVLFSLQEALACVEEYDIGDYFFPIGEDMGGNLFAEVRRGGYMGTVGDLDHGLLAYYDSLDAHAAERLPEEPAGADVSALDKDVVANLFCDPEGDLLVRHAPSLDEFLQHCIYQEGDGLVVVDAETREAL